MKFDPEAIWIDFCRGEKRAKVLCRVYLKTYVHQHATRRVCLGEDEWATVRTLIFAVTPEDVWAALIMTVDNGVLERKRQEDYANAGLWHLLLASQSRRGNATTSPAIEISKVS